jgi:hypothetical protein
MQAMEHWIARDVPVALLALEKDRQYHLTRALAQLHNNANLTSDEWASQNPDAIRAAYAEHEGELARMGESVWDAKASVTIEWVGQWVAARAQEGRRIIAVDPVTAADSGPKPWLADKEFILGCLATAAKHGCSVLLVTHPRMTKGQKPSLETMSGGMAYARFPDVVLWLARHDPPDTGMIHTPCGPITAEYTHHVALFKTRDCSGQGMHVAFTFDKSALKFHEHGWVEKQK